MMNKGLILIVDDDQNLCRSLQMILEKKNYAVECAYSGSEALEKTKDKDFILALLDIRLPDMTGHELLKQIQHMNSRTSFIMITGFASLESAIEAVKHNVFAYITKPLDIDQVLTIIDAFMERHQLLLEKRIAELEKLRKQEELEIYASLLRHDVLNDLQIIIGNIECIQHFTLDSCDEVHDLLVGTLAATERMSALAKVLGKPRTSEPEKIIRLLREVAEQTEKTNRGLSIHIHADEDTETVDVKGNRLLPMVFENLFRNAALYAGDFPNVNVYVSKDCDKIELIVSDDGPGIDSKIKDHLFERGISTSGSGLGLYLSHKIITSAGGTMDLIDSDKPGAAFRITLLVAENH